MSSTDPEVLFEDLSDEPPEDEAAADCGEVPVDLIELSEELEQAGVTPEEFQAVFGDAS